MLAVLYSLYVYFHPSIYRGRRGCCGRMVVGLTTRCAVDSNPASWRGVFDKHYMIKFVSDLRHVSGFLQVLRFLPPIKLTALI